MLFAPTYAQIGAPHVKLNGEERSVETGILQVVVEIIKGTPPLQSIKSGE